ncbi:Uncharacterised protein [Klebsiella aerogenes]|nr:Uncharacterised protein [Klebsiella aerogenes]
MEACQLQRIFSSQRIVVVFKPWSVDRQWIDHIAFRQLPRRGDFGELLGIDFDFARWRGQRVGLRIVTEGFIRHMMTLRVTLLEDALLAESIEIRKFGNRFTRLLIQITHPAFLSAAFGKLLRHPHTFRQLGGHLIDGFAFETRFDSLVGKDHVGHIAAGGIQREVHLLRGGTVR